MVLKSQPGLELDTTPIKPVITGLEMVHVYYDGKRYQIALSQILRQGIDGLDNYQLAKAHGMPNTENVVQYLESLYGPPGPQGVRGDRGMSGKDAEDLETYLRRTYPQAFEGDKSLIDVLRGSPGANQFETAKLLYPEVVRTREDWVRLFQGAPGPRGNDGLRGERGLPGKDGKDGQHGQDGQSFIEWLQIQVPTLTDLSAVHRFFKGDQGPRGIPGEKGRDGRDGKDGAVGNNGADGAKGDKGDPGEGLKQILSRIDPSVKTDRDVQRMLMGRPGIAKVKPGINDISITEDGEIYSLSSSFVQVEGQLIATEKQHNHIAYNPDFNEFSLFVPRRLPDGYVIHVMGPTKLQLEKGVKVVGTGDRSRVDAFVKGTLTKLPGSDTFWLTRSI